MLPSMEWGRLVSTKSLVVWRGDTCSTSDRGEDEQVMEHFSIFGFGGFDAGDFFRAFLMFLAVYFGNKHANGK